MFQFSLSSFQSVMSLLAQAFLLVFGFSAVVVALRYKPRPEEREIQRAISIRDSFRRLLALRLIPGGIALGFSVLSAWFEHQNAPWLSGVLASVAGIILIMFCVFLWYVYMFVLQVTELDLSKTVECRVGTRGAVERKLIRKHPT